jgi:RNA ligase (TIGR02306 family)
MKMIDLINASFAQGTMPGAEGMVDPNAVRNARLLLDANGAALPDSVHSDGEAAEGTAELAAEGTGDTGGTGSDWVCAVVRITGARPIPNADSIECAEFTFEDVPERGVPFVSAYPVVVRKGTYQAGDKAVYVPVDSVLPPAPEFSFLGSDVRRLRAKRLRGVYSEGLLVPWADFAAIVGRTVPDGFGSDAAEVADKTGQALDELLPVGADVAELLGVTRYREFLRGGPGRGEQRVSRGPDESVFPYYTVGNARKGEGIQHLAGDTRVIVTEKLHGANIRFGWVKQQGESTELGKLDSGDTAWVFRLGSHRVMREYPYGDWFGSCYQINDLEGQTEDLHGIVFYGEVLGVQDLTYGYGAGFGLRIFDAYDSRSERWMHWGQIVEACKIAGFDHVPVLYDGPLNECNYQEMAEGETRLTGVSHVREGVVIRTYAGGGTHRRWKFVGQGYKLRKNQKDLVTE